jgi:hypothetical protein
MSELGAKRFFDMHCADEATGLEEVVESWNDEVVENLTTFLEKEDEDAPKA